MEAAKVSRTCEHFNFIRNSQATMLFLNMEYMDWDEISVKE